MDLRTTSDGITPAQLGGFFEGWPNPPTPQTLHRLLTGAPYLALAVEDGEVIGFVYAVSDGVLCAYIPLLEVRAEWRGRGIASALMDLLMEQLGGLYMVDTACDDALVPFYEGFGLRRATAMVRRDYARQSGRLD
jgi:ribosomal protein S18 acetylase RimI-like enzyme